MNKLSPEEIAERRAKFFEESDNRMRLIEKAMAASNDGQHGQWLALNQELADSRSETCEHGTSWVEECDECTDIHIQCFPEFFVACPTCGQLVDTDEPDQNGKCFNCL